MADNRTMDELLQAPRRCMRTRNSYYPNNLSVTISRRRNKRRALNVVEPELRTIVEIAPMADNRTMEKLLQAPTEGDVLNDVIKLMMFPYSLKGIARVWYDKEPPNSILTWDDLVNKFVNQFFPPSKTTHLKNEIARFTQRFEQTFGEAWERFKEMLRVCPHHGFTDLTQIDTFYNCLNDNDQDSLNATAGGNLLSKTTREALNIIENKSKVHYSRNKPNVSRMNMNSRENASKTDDWIDKLADQISTLVDIVSKKVVTLAAVKAVKESCVTCGGNHAYYNWDATNSNQLSIYAATSSYNQVIPQNRASNHMAPPGFALEQNSQNRFFQNQASTSGTLPSNTIPNPKVERETKETMDKEQTYFQGSTAHIQPPVVPIPEPDVPKTLPNLNIPYPSRLNDQKLREKATNQMEKFFQILQDLHFDISFADALLLMPKFASTIKSLLANKDKLFELAKIPLNENCSSINLMPLSIWKNLSLPEVTPTRMTLELADRSITRPKGVAEDVFVKVGKFHFPNDFVVVDFKADPQVPLILGRSVLRTGRALIDVYGEEITLQVNDEAITFNLNKTTRYSSTYDDMSVNQIDVINVAREDYAQEMLGFSKNSSGGNPTLTFEPIISDSSPSLTPFEGNGFFGYFQIPINPPDQEKTTFTCPYGTFAYRRMPFGLCNAPGTFQRSFSGHADFYQRFIQDFSKIARPMTHLVEKETPFVFSKDCIDAFETLKKKLTEAPILVVPDWNLHFELMCDASDFAIGAVLGQRKTKHFQPI
nr:reverse transcriptase domain-containing protein [Tanacetum cinerariifolium]